jgi:UDP:flavonoid glycosyltransferase YjiC (YdhE family)
VRLLFASTQGAGHFGPLIPFLDAAVRTGHDVLVVGPPTLNPRGFPFRAGASPPDEVLGPLWGRMPSLPPGQGDVVVVGVIFARLNVEAMLPALSAAIEEWRPDVVLREGAEFASAIAADLHRVPQVRVAVGPTLVEDSLLGLAAPALDDRRAGLAERIAASPMLTLWPDALDPPLFDVVRFRHPTTDAVAANGAPEADDGRPLVYVSFGSVAATFPPAAQVYRSALEALSELPVRALLTTGGHDVELGSVPENVRVERWVDEPDVLPHASAAVGHGGAGTTLSAMAAGCPQVVVPLFGDQPANAMRVARARAGVVAPVDDIGAALERVLGDESYGAGARRVAAEMRTLPPPDAALDLLAGLRS